MRIPPGAGALTGALLTALTLARSFAQAQEADAARAVIRVPTVSADAETPDDPEHRWAVLIGVDQYDSEAIRDLRYAGNDVRTIADRLVQSGSWRRDHIIVMTSNATDPALRPTMDNINARLDWLLSLSGAHTVLFYFSGHGLAYENLGRTANFLLPANARINAAVAPLSAIEEGWLISTLNGVPARQRLVIMDACRNEPVESRARAVAPLSAARPPPGEGTQILRATAAGQVSLESDACQMGVFSCEVARGLTGQADGFGGAPRDGLVEVGELFDFVRNELQVAAQGGNAQIPELDGAHSGDFVVVTLPAPPGPLPSPGVVTEVVSTDVRQGIVRVSGDAAAVKIRGADQQEHVSGALVAPGQYAIYARFDGFHIGPAGFVQVRPGEEASVHCDARFVSCDLERYVRVVGEGE